MKKMLLAGSASLLLLALALPAGALAHSRGHHRSARHSLRHHRRHAAIQVRDFHASAAPSSTGSQPTTPPTPEKAGTVVSFTNGVLTIKLASDGSLVSGKVTEDTEVHCAAASASGGDDEQGDASSTSAHESSVSGDEQSQEGDDQGDQGEGGQSCSSNPLVEGASVLDAELAITPQGAVWRHIDLLQ
jgi:hypothetical protein